MGFAQGKIYQGKLKTVCVPGLNCYSCPGAWGSCPIGSLQSVLTDRSKSFSFYVFGILILFGVVLGRFVCGWLCPFGLIQDLLHKIPCPKKIRTFKFDRQLRYMKYIILVLFVILLPLTVVDIVGQGKPWFCAYICPSGTLFGGIPLVASNKLLQKSLGWLFRWKVVILVMVSILAIVVYRPFCKYICPLGAIYGLFNKISLYKFSVTNEKCTNCNACSNVCPMNIDVKHSPNSAECIRCGKCVSVCTTNALEIDNLTRLVKLRKQN